ncbi:WD40/YVTN/BNR-like repeat-containing protein [Pseudomonas luteola]
MAITPLPTPPRRSDAPADFTAKADTFLAALPNFGAEANQLASDLGSTIQAAKTDIGDSVKTAQGAATSATSSSQTATNAATAAKNSQDAAKASEQSAQTFASAAGAAAGLPALAGKAGRSLIVNSDEKGVSWGTTSRIGDVLFSAYNVVPDPSVWKECSKTQMFPKTQAPELFALIGQLPNLDDFMDPTASVTSGPSNYALVAQNPLTSVILGANASGATGSISRSTNIGSSWVAVSTGQTSSSHAGIATDGQGTFMLSMATSANTRISTDDGTTWSALNPVTGAPAGGRVWYAKGAWYYGSQVGQIYRSTNNGASWTRLAAIPGIGTALSIGNIKEIFGVVSLSYDGGVAYSTDGITFTVCTLDTSDAIGAAWPTGLVTFVAGTSPIVILRGASSSFLATTSDGLTWRLLPFYGPFSAASSIIALGDAFLVVSTSGNYFSRDGQYWTLLDTVPSANPALVTQISPLIAISSNYIFRFKNVMPSMFVIPRIKAPLGCRSWIKYK